MKSTGSGTHELYAGPLPTPTAFERHPMKATTTSSAFRAAAKKPPYASSTSATCRPRAAKSSGVSHQRSLCSEAENAPGWYARIVPPTGARPVATTASTPHPDPPAHTEPNLCARSSSMMSEYTQDDFDDLVRALRRYVDEDMDQFAGFRIHTNFDDAYVQIDRGLPPGHSNKSYPLYEPGVTGRHTDAAPAPQDP